MTRKQRILIVGLSAVLLVYVTSFIAISRPAISTARSYNTTYYYFVSPRTNNGFRKHWMLRLLFYPLWQIESAVGEGFEPARSQPMYDLSSYGAPQGEIAADAFPVYRVDAASSATRISFSRAASMGFSPGFPTHLRRIVPV